MANEFSQESFNSYLSQNLSNSENDDILVNNIGNMSYNQMKKLTKLSSAEVHSYDRPYFIVLYGPPGSGKSSSTPLIEDLGVPYAQYVTVILDDMITSVRKYRNVTKKLKENHNAARITNSQFWSGIDKIFNKTRIGKKGNGTGESINAMRTNILNEALANNKNIIYETTGASKGGQDFLNMLLRDAIPENYRVIILYPMVSLEQLKERVRTRAERFLTLTTPYYRSQKPEKLNNMRYQAIKFFKETLMETFINGYTDKNGKKREIFKIIAYQNEEQFSEPQILA